MTRKEKAKELHRLAFNGPSMDMTFICQDVADLTLTVGQRHQLEVVMERRYRLWATTWLLPPIAALVPELKHLAD